ncbi:MAG: glycerol-3-phosphate acyltransferase, partial [Pseudomonadota bacterium]
SGNIGATNVLRTGNKTAAGLTTLFDALKGLIPVLIFLNWGDLAGQAAALGAVIGHCFPVWLKFRGGKAVATFIGVTYGLFWPAGIVVCAVWLAAAAISRISSVAGLAATLSAPIAMLLFDRWEAVLTAILLTLIVWVRHHSNIARLFAGTEPRIGARK